MILPKRKPPTMKKKSIIYPTRPCKFGCPDLMRRMQKERDLQAAAWGNPHPLPSNSRTALLKP